MNPKSWWWTPEMDFLSAILVTVQGANWQRGGGKGPMPERVEWPSDKPESGLSPADLTARKQWMKDELQRRRKKMVGNG